MRRFSRKNLKAISLIEVLAVLVLTGVLLLATARMTSNLIIQLRNNELEEYANSLLVQAFEAAKSPNNLTVNIAHQPFGSGYRIEFLSAGGAKLTRMVSFLSSPNITTCSTASPYFINSATVTGFVGPVPVCIQAVIRTLTNPFSGTAYYEFLTRVIYTTPKRTDIFNLVSYRYAGFTVQP